MTLFVQSCITTDFEDFPYNPEELSIAQIILQRHLLYLAKLSHTYCYYNEWGLLNKLPSLHIPSYILISLLEYLYFMQPYIL